MTTAPASDYRELSRMFHALSDETRLRIVNRLRKGEHCVCDLTDALDAAQSRLSFHLRTLKDAGLVVDRKEGRWSYYRLRPEVLSRIEAVLGDMTEDAVRCCVG